MFSRTSMMRLKHVNAAERVRLASDLEAGYSLLKTAYIPDNFDPNTVKQLGEMQVSREVSQMRERCRLLRYTTPPSRLNRQYALGFVPTMGQLHDGHMALIEASQAECVFTAVSIFVNPTQFGAGEDFNKYPRNLDRDLRILAEAKVDCVYLPTKESMYPPGYKMYSYYKGADNMPEGLSRDGHFEGVSTVCTKLFHIVEPDITYIGQKDAMQCIVLGAVARDFNMTTQVRVCPVVREIDGLALSSRNIYLSAEQRSDAVGISKALEEINNQFRSISLTQHGEGNRLPTAKEVKDQVRLLFAKYITIGEPDYVSVGRNCDMQEIADDEPVPVVCYFSKIFL